MKQTDFGVQMTSFFTMYLPTRRDLSDNTISSYRDTFKLLLSFSESVNGIPADKLKLKDFTEPFVSNFINPKGKPETEKQIRKWLADPYTDSAEYKLWGNGVSLPITFFVLSGIVWANDLEKSIVMSK